MDETYEIARREHVINYWLGKRNIPPQKYWGLETTVREILRDHISKAHRASYQQLKDLDEKLRSVDVIMGRHFRQDDFRSPDQLDSFYSLTNEDILSCQNMLPLLPAEDLVIEARERQKS